MGLLANITKTRADAWKNALKWDGWENAVNLIGTSMASLTYHRMQAGDWLTTEELQSLYEQDPIAHRIIVEPVDDAFRQGWDLTPPMAAEGEDRDADADKEIEKQIREYLVGIKAEPLLKKTLYWGRRDGRGGLWLGTDDGPPDTELEPERVGEIKWLRDLDAGEFTAGYLDDDEDSPTFGEPVIWAVTLSTGGVSKDVDTSRILLTGAIPTTRRRRQENEWRDIPVLHSVYEDLRNYDSTKTGMAQMLTDASQALLKIQNLPGILAENPTLLRARMRILELSRALHILLLDAGNGAGQNAEEFSFAERTFSGVAETFDRILGALSSAIGWPQTKLFGRSPAGENATGESDQDIWDDMVKAEQEIYRPLLQEVVTLAAYALGVADPEGWTVVFRPLRQEDPTEMAANQKTIAETDVLYITNGVVDELDVREHRFEGDLYDPSPLRISEETSEASKLLQGQDLERAQTGEPAGAGIEPGSATAPAENIEKTMLNGAQLGEVTGVMVMVGAKELPRESAVEYLAEFYPIEREAAERVMGPIGKTWFAGGKDGTELEPPPPPPPPPAFGGAPAPAPAKGVNPFEPKDNPEDEDEDNES